MIKCPFCGERIDVSLDSDAVLCPRCGKNIFISSKKSDRTYLERVKFKVKRLLATPLGKIFVSIFAAILAFFLLSSLALGVFLGVDAIVSQIKYEMALNAFEDCDYETSYRLFKSLGNYKDSDRYLCFALIGYEKHSTHSVTMQGFDVTENDEEFLLYHGRSGAFDSRYEYDGSGRMVSAEHTDKHNGSVYITRYTYNERGDVTRITMQSDEKYQEYDLDKFNKDLLVERPVVNNFIFREANEQCLYRCDGKELARISYDQSEAYVGGKLLNSDGNDAIVFVRYGDLFGFWVKDRMGCKKIDLSLGDGELNISIFDLSFGIIFGDEIFSVYFANDPVCLEIAVDQEARVLGVTCFNNSDTSNSFLNNGIIFNLRLDLENITGSELYAQYCRYDGLGIAKKKYRLYVDLSDKDIVRLIAEDISYDGVFVDY